MTATDELRKMLDERGVGWRDEHNTFDYITKWHANGVYANFSEDKGLVEPDLLVVYYEDLTPAQAIAATMGAGTCKRVMDSLDPFTQWVCNQCGHPLDASDKFCSGCGRRVVDE